MHPVPRKVHPNIAQCTPCLPRTVHPCFAQCLALCTAPQRGLPSTCSALYSPLTAPCTRCGVQVRDYHRQTLQLLRRQSYDGLVAGLSPQLATEVHYQLGTWIMQCVWWMRALDRSLLRDLFTRMQREAFAVRERIDASCLRVLCLGVRLLEIETRAP